MHVYRMPYYRVDSKQELDNKYYSLNALTTGHSFGGTNLLKDSIGRDFGGSKGVLRASSRSCRWTSTSQPKSSRSTARPLSLVQNRHANGSCACDDWKFDPPRGKHKRKGRPGIGRPIRAGTRHGAALSTPPALKTPFSSPPVQRHSIRRVCLTRSELFYP